VRSPVPVAIAAAVALLASGALLAGCVRGPDLTTAPPSPASSGTPGGAVPLPSLPVNQRPTLPAGPTTPVFPEHTAVPCAGHPTGQQIVALLRRTTSLLPASGTVTLGTGPLCSGTWQYSILLVPEHDPLQVVTEGAPSSLRLVTAGTDVCTIAVRATAPAGIRAVTQC